jgi:hypothetical protein
MTYKNTIEIITKDIQDIEKLVDNFKNYSSVPSIEMDLALSKLRNIYDILLMLKDSKSDTSNEDLMFIEDKTEAVVEEKETISEEMEKKEENEEEEGKTSEEKAEEKDKVKDEKGSTGRGTLEATETPESRTSEIIAEPVENKEDLHTPKSDIQKSSVTVSGKKSKPAEPILGETFRENKGFIYEKLGEQSRKPDLTSKLQSTPIKSIAGSLGINDKFFFIRELFNGNAEEFRNTIEILDNAGNFNEAYTFLIENLDWDMESEPVQQLLNLIRRKFISREDE